MATGTTNVLNTSTYSLTLTTEKRANIILTKINGQIITERVIPGSGKGIMIPNLEAGDYILKGSSGRYKINKIISITKDTTEMLYFGFIFGIQRQRATSADDQISSAWTRTDDARNMIAVSGCYDIPGYSDFDGYYPWKGMRQERIGNSIMVRIPKFYYKRVVENNIDSIKISMVCHPGFSIHPLFTSNGYEAEYAYVGAYLTGPGGTQSSPSNKILEKEFSKTEFRTLARSIGEGWRQFDIYMMSALQMLILVEYADNNVQKIIGRGNVSNTSEDALIMAATTTKTAYHTEVYQNDGKNSVVYRDITDLWGKLNIWVDGVTWTEGRKYYIYPNPENYATASTQDAVALSYLFPTGFADIDNMNTPPKATIVEVGYDPDYPFLMFPLYVKKGIDSLNYGYCDGTGGWNTSNKGTTSIADPIMFGCYGNNYGAGLFCFTAWNRGSKARTATGGRLMYIPPQK